MGYAYEEYEINELIKNINNIETEKMLSDDSENLESLRNKLWELFKRCHVPEEINYEIDFAVCKGIRKGYEQYTVSLDKLSYSKENGIKFQMSFRTRDKKEYNVNLGKDENGNYISIIENREFVPIKDGIVNSITTRRTSKKNDDGLYICQINKITQENALDSSRIVPTSKPTVELIKTEVLEGYTKTNIEEYNGEMSEGIGKKHI